MGFAVDFSLYQSLNGLAERSDAFEDVTIWLRHRRAGWLALGLATLVSVSRVAVGTHYPTDVLGGAVLGTLAAVVLWLPPIRRLLHDLADWAGSLYERAAQGMARSARRA